MESLTISNFKFGLDARRSELTSQPGTLQTAENVFIDAGGDLNKRMAFVLFANLGILDSNGAQGTFGLRETDSGLMTFGSALPFGASVTQNQPTLASAMPAGVVYQQLQHPEIIVGLSNYNTAYHRMTKAVFTRASLGKAFVAALFTDGHTFLYYNGSLVNSSFNGIITQNQSSLALISAELTREIQNLGGGWQSNTSVGLSGRDQVSAPPGANFTPIATKNSAAGVLGSILQSGAADTTDAGHAGVAAKSAAVAWTLSSNGSNGTVTMTAFSDVVGTIPVTLANAVARNAGGANNTVADVVAAINVGTLFHGYSASASTNVCTVYAPASFGNVTFNLTVTLTGDMAQGSGSSGIAFQLVLNPSTLSVIKTGKSGSATVSGYMTANTSGGSGGVTFAWSETTSPVSGIAMSSTTAAVVNFSKTLLANQSVNGTFKCIATDGASHTSTVFFSVNLEYDNNL